MIGAEGGDFFGGGLGFGEGVGGAESEAFDVLDAAGLARCAGGWHGEARGDGLFVAAEALGERGFGENAVDAGFVAKGFDAGELAAGVRFADGTAEQGGEAGDVVARGVA